MAYAAKVTMNRGEVTPLVHSRGDIDFFQAAMRALDEWYCLKEGGIRRRSGSRFRGRIKYATKDVRLVDFVFAQSYVVEVGDQYTRFWSELGQVLDGNDDPYEIASPYVEADLRGLQWAQSYDVIYVAFASKTIKPKKLQRFGHDDWSWTDVDFVDGPYLPINDTGTTVATSGAPVAGGSQTLTFSSVNGINGGQGILATDVGRLVRAQFGGGTGWSWGTITARNSSTEIVVLFKGGAGGTGDTASWRLGSFSETTGYPGSVHWFQGRLFWGRTDANPTTVFYSMSNFPEVMSPSAVDGTVADDHGGAFDIRGRSDEIVWLRDGPRLQIGTAGAIRTLGASNPEQAFGPRNISQRLEVSGGCEKVQPVGVGPSTVHAGRFGTSLNDLFADYNVSSLVAPELSILSNHMLDDGAKEIVFQQKPASLLWSVLNNGRLTASTLERYEKVIGWSKHHLSGDAFARSACVIPGTRRQDELYVAVRRTVDGQQVTYMETLEPPFQRRPKTEAFFVDCGGQYSGAPTNTVTGIDWLEGVEVDILADGHVLPRQTVKGFAIELPGDRQASVITFGIPIVDGGGLLPPPIGAPDGAALGRKMRVTEVIADVYETLGLKLVSDRGEIDAFQYRPADTPMNASPALVTGPVDVPVDGSWTSQGMFDFFVREPLPATIRAFNIGLEYEP